MNITKTIFCFFCLTFLILSCKTKSTVSDTNDVYEVVYKSQIGGKKEKSNVIITNYEDFNALISELNIDEEEYEKLLKIDLEKHNLIVSFLGEKTTGGYDIDINEVNFTPTQVNVLFKEISPEKNAMVTMSFTSPYIFVVVPKNKEINIK